MNRILFQSWGAPSAPRALTEFHGLEDLNKHPAIGLRRLKLQFGQMQMRSSPRRAKHKGVQA